MSWIFSVVRVVHILSCFFLIVVVLLQAGKGAGIGSAFGGAGSAVFGGRGAGGFISKVTWVVAGTFMLTSVSLAWRSTQRGSAALQKESKPVSPEKLLLADEVPEDVPDIGLDTEDATPIDEVIDVPEVDGDDVWPGESADDDDSADVLEEASEEEPPEEEPLEEPAEDDSKEAEPARRAAPEQPVSQPARERSPRREASEVEIEPPRPSTDNGETPAEKATQPVDVDDDVHDSD